MKIEDFKLVENKQRPNFCYSYERYNNDKTKKYSIFTMDGGNTFLASVDEKRMDGKFYNEFSNTFTSIDESLKSFN